jgi:hypothetical protein
MLIISVEMTDNAKTRNLGKYLNPSASLLISQPSHCLTHKHGRQVAIGRAPTHYQTQSLTRNTIQNGPHDSYGTTRYSATFIRHYGLLRRRKVQS